jgi:hypothetical protein
MRLARGPWILLGALSVIVAVLLVVLGVGVSLSVSLADISPVFFGLGLAFFSLAIDEGLGPIARIAFAVVAFAVGFGAWAFIIGPSGPLALLGGP